MTVTPFDRVLIAPDAFKGSLSCTEVARAMARGLAGVWPHSELQILPMTDGGEGAIDAISTALEGALRPVSVTGPYGVPVEATWWRSRDTLAVVEMARASGLSLSARRDPMVATSIGTGQLLRAALDDEAEEIWLCCGGSATVDGGAGLLVGLGFELLDTFGRPIAPGGGGLIELVDIRPPASMDSVNLKVLCDVVNPLTGPEGAAFVYGPQKGASREDVAKLDEGLGHLAEVLSRTFGKNPMDLVGGGAAGGIPAALWSAYGAQLCGGFETVSNRLALADAVGAADLVITGEGCIDHQTPYGKTIGGLLHLARQQGVSVWAFGGRVTPEAKDWCPEGLSLMPITEPNTALDYAMAHASDLIQAAVAHAALGFRSHPELH